jgi:uncharacterized protein (TIGR00369 family)
MAPSFVVQPHQCLAAVVTLSTNLPGVAAQDDELITGHTPLQTALGIHFVNLFRDPDDTSVTVQAEARDDLKGPAGSMEGGVVATLLDYAGATAAAKALNGLVATQSLTISFLAPVKVGPARAVGVPVRAGKRDAVIEVKMYDVGRDNRLCATALLTAVRIGDRPTLDGA